jgi:hypothetical protein
MKDSLQTLSRFLGFCDSGSGICSHGIAVTEAATLVGNVDPYAELIRAGARRLTSLQRRLFQAEVGLALGDGSPRQAERRFGGGRGTIAKGLHEYHSVLHGRENFAARGRHRSEDQDPRLAQDIRAIVEPQTDADPELKSARRYTHRSAAEVRAALIATGGYRAEDLPKEWTMRDILNRMGYRLQRIEKGKPLKETKQTDAILAHIAAVRAEVRGDPETLEILIDTKAKVAVGDSVRGRSRTDSQGEVEPGWDHDPPAKEKSVPFGVLVLWSGALTLVFGSGESSDFWVDALQTWWRGVRAKSRGLRQLEGYTRVEIAQRLGCAERAVRRKLDIIREAWL